MAHWDNLRRGLLVAGVLLIGAAVAFIIWPGTAGVTRAITTGTAPDTTVTTHPGHTAHASDTLIVFLFGIGIALALAAGFYSRITTLTVGGVAINLSPAASAKLAAHVSEHVGNDPQAVEKAYRIAHASLSADYWGKVANPPDPELEAAAATAAKVVQAGK